MEHHRWLYECGENGFEGSDRAWWIQRYIILGRTS